MENNQLGNFLKKARKACGYTQEFAASHISISQQEYSHYETGRAIPSPKSCQLLAELYDVPFSILMSLLTDNTLPQSDESDSHEKFFSFLENEANTKKLSGLTRREKELIYSFSLLSERDQKLVLEFIKIMSTR